MIFKSCRGFSLAETMISFSMWMLIVSVLIPQLVLLTQERINTQQAVTALKLLHEKTQMEAFANEKMVNETIIKNNVMYNLTWEEEYPNKKACMEWTNTYQKTKSVCLLVS